MNVNFVCTHSSLCPKCSSCLSWNSATISDSVHEYGPYLPMHETEASATIYTVKTGIAIVHVFQTEHLSTVLLHMSHQQKTFIFQ